MIKMEITFLGTSSMVPTKKRNQQAIFLKYGSEGILIDCGEGTQRQFKLAKLKITKITKILITHWHGDHVFGIPGILQSLHKSQYTKTLEIYGPKGIKKQMSLLLKTFPAKTNIKIKIKEIKKGIFFENEKFLLSCLPLKHSIKTFAYSFEEKEQKKLIMSKLSKFKIPGPLLGKLQKGNTIKWKNKTYSPNKFTKSSPCKKIAIVSDTLLNKNCYQIAKNANLLICEATYLDVLKQKAKKHLHMTAKNAAIVANQSKAKKLILTHFSNRYSSTSALKKEAQKIFKNTSCAKDLMKIKI